MKELTVTYRGHGQLLELGTLAQDRGGILFQYSAAAIAQGLQLSPIRLPLRAAAYPDRQTDYLGLHQVPGLVYDSLPDSWGFRLMHRRLKAHGIDTDALSTLDELAWMGDNTLGALTYAPAAGEQMTGQDLDLMTLAAQVQAVLQDEDFEVLAEMARAGGSPGGARPKALVYFDPARGRIGTQPGQGNDAQQWLVKFRGEDDAQDSCALEALYARVAHHCGLGMTPFHLFELPKGGSAFGTQRFDRQGGRRVHVHSLAGLLHADFRVPSVSYEDFFRATRRLTRDVRELSRAVQRCAFNVLMNNRDDHAKNLSFMLGADGEWRLAPPYDLTWCPGYQGEHFMDVAGEGKEPGREHMLHAAKSAGLAETDTAAVIDLLLDSITPDLVAAMAQDLPLHRSTVAMVVEAVSAHHARLRKA